MHEFVTERIVQKNLGLPSYIVIYEFEYEHLLWCESLNILPEFNFQKYNA